MAKTPPAEVAKIRAEIRTFLNTVDSATGRPIGSAKCGVYLFYDYDGEPIYVGQTVEQLRTRIGRHLTGRRSDAVAKFVLDPFEVLEIEVWPLFAQEAMSRPAQKQFVAAAEHAVFERAIAASRFGAVLNEKLVPRPARSIRLPRSWRSAIIPDDLIEDRQHPDVRIARRAQTIASLARMISERSVDDGIRDTLLVQTQRLEFLARRRLDD